MRNLVLLTALLLIGCSSDPSGRVVGIWRANPKKSHFPELPFPLPTPGMDMQKQEKLFFKNCQLQLRSDNTFVLAAGQTVDGSWTLANQAITLKPKAQASKSPMQLIGDSPLTAKLSKDLDSMELDLPSPIGDFQIVLDKTG